jgi:hypothetical protein
MSAINATGNNLPWHRPAILQHAAHARFLVKSRGMYQVDYKGQKNDQEKRWNTETEEILNLCPTGERNVR